jgi:hypothetical protein
MAFYFPKRASLTPMVDSKETGNSATETVQVEYATEGHGQHKEVNTASVALTAALEQQKPNIWSKNMIKLYAIMGVGYLISTMNGFGEHLSYYCAVHKLQCILSQDLG